MMARRWTWILAAAACAALALLTLPPVRSLNVAAPAEEAAGGSG